MHTINTQIIASQMEGVLQHTNSSYIKPEIV